MGKDKNGSTAFSVLVIQAAAVLAPLLAIAALVAWLGPGDDDVDAQPVVPVAVAESSPGAPSDTGGSSTASPRGEPKAFVGGAGGRQAPGGGDDDSEATRAGASESEGAFPPEPGAEERNPIVWVRRDERVRVLDAPGGNIVATRSDETEFGSPSVFSVIRTTNRWIGVSTPELPNGEVGWIRADPEVLRTGYVSYSVTVDLSDRSAELFDGGLRVRSWPVTVGAPGSETPTGTFGVTDTFRGDLNPAYGCCAVALSATQPNLPSGWLGGDRIAVHGTDGPLGVAESSGCVRSRDEDVANLVETLPLGTPVTIRE